MKKIIFIISVTILVSCNYNIQNNSWIRINHLGYTPESIKNAVFVSKEINEIESFEIIYFHTNELVQDSYKIVPKGSYGPYNIFYLDLIFHLLKNQENITSKSIKLSQKFL